MTEITTRIINMRKLAKSPKYKIKNNRDWIISLSVLSLVYFVVGLVFDIELSISWSLLFIGFTVYCFVRWIYLKRKFQKIPNGTSVSDE